MLTLVSESSYESLPGMSREAAATESRFLFKKTLDREYGDSNHGPRAYKIDTFALRYILHLNRYSSLHAVFRTIYTFICTVRHGINR